jgi:hypothetical protein
MSAKIDLADIRETYRKMTNQQLVNAATHDAKGLTEEAQQIIKEELMHRNLDASLLKSVDAQNQDYSLQDVDNYCYLIQKLDCPVCGKKYDTLNATVTMDVMSYIIFTQHKKKLKIACSECLNKANNKATLKSVLFGWWGLPHGIIKTIQAISVNQKSKKANASSEPNKFLRSFVQSNIGLIELYKDNKEKLQTIISKFS